MIAGLGRSPPSSVLEIACTYLECCGHPARHHSLDLEVGHAMLRAKGLSAKVRSTSASRSTNTLLSVVRASLNRGPASGATGWNLDRDERVPHLEGQDFGRGSRAAASCRALNKHNQKIECVSHTALIHKTLAKTDSANTTRCRSCNLDRR